MTRPPSSTVTTVQSSLTTSMWCSMRMMADAPLMDAPDDLDESQHVGMGQARCGFVQDQEVRLPGQGPGDLQEALVAVGEVLGAGAGLVLEADEVEQGQGVGPGPPFLALCQAQQHQGQRAPVDALEGHHDVLEGGEFPEELEVLEGAGDARLAPPGSRLPAARARPRSRIRPDVGG